MWRNEDVASFIEWQRAFNDAGPPQGKTGFYGLDLYSLHASIEAVLDYFDRTDPVAARSAANATHASTASATAGRSTA